MALPGVGAVYGALQLLGSQGDLINPVPFLPGTQWVHDQYLEMSDGLT